MTDPALFHCCDHTTPTIRLAARHRMATSVVVTWLGSVAAMASGLLSVVIFGPTSATVVELAISTATGMLAAVPAICLMPIVGELERELGRRGELGLGFRPLADRVPGYVMRAVGGFSLAVLALRFLG